MSSSRPARIEAIAASILAQSISELGSLSLNVSIPPIPIVELCELKGLSVLPKLRLVSQASKLSGLLRPLQRSICYEAADTLGRQHFTIAHELGHYIIHWAEMQNKYQNSGAHLHAVEFVDTETVFTRLLEHPQDDIDEETIVYLRDSSGDHVIRTRQIETEANYFAQFIMMPENLIKEAAIAVEGLPYETASHVLAHQFEVSDYAMDVRLKQLGLPTEFEQQHEHKFFIDLGKSVTASDNRTHTCSDNGKIVTVAPQSRLRTLITEVDQIAEDTDQVILDFHTFQGSSLNLLGVAQALELALVHDYILEYGRRSICYIFPDNSGHIIRHMGRLGLLSHLGIDNTSGQYLIEPQALITGNQILLKLCQIDGATNLEKLALCTKDRVLEWMYGVDELEKFANLAATIVFQLTHEIAQYSSDSLGCGSGYLAIELQPILSDSDMVGYRLVFAAGDIGISLRQRLHIYFEIEAESDYEAVEVYSFDRPECATLIRDVTQNGGYLQINAGEVTYHMGRGSKNFFTGLHQTPGLQIAVVLSAMVNRGA